MDFQILSVVDNTVYPSGLLGEHGLSFYIEYKGAAFLFDTGQGPAFRHNAETLKIPFQKIDGMVISHGHYDHTGNMDYVLDKNPSLPVYIHEQAVYPKFRKYPGGNMKFIGMPKTALDALKNKKEVVYNEGPMEISQDMFLTGTVPRINDFEKANPFFFSDAEGKIADYVPDDQSIYIITEKGVILILGCCHSGLVNTLEHVRKHSGQNHFLAVFGGTHLKNTDESTLKIIANSLKSFQIDKMYLCHCTGTRPIYLMEKETQIKCSHFTVGQNISFA